MTTSILTAVVRIDQVDVQNGLRTEWYYSRSMSLRFVLLVKGLNLWSGNNSTCPSTSSPVGDEGGGGRISTSGQDQCS